ncbi:MAG: HAD domain-containing protein [Patescibacteria group bacterium]
MKYIFLDVDGVLNDEEFMVDSRIEYRAYKEGCGEPSHVDFYCSMLNPEKIALLKQIVDASGAEIILSSSWRCTNPEAAPMVALREMLGEQGMSIKDITPHGCGLCVRGNEIRSWLQKNVPYDTPYGYVILDDDSDMLYWQRNNFVHTDGRIGLTERDVAKAIKILNKRERA